MVGFYILFSKDEGAFVGRDLFLGEDFTYWETCGRFRGKAQGRKQGPNPMHQAGEPAWLLLRGGNGLTELRRAG